MLVETEPLLQMMTPEQKAAQMLLVSYPWTELTSEWEAHYRKLQVGGVILRGHNFQKAAQVRALIEQLQDFARETAVGIPLMVAVAQEGGSTSALSFARAIHPGNMALGATRNSEYAYEAARLTAAELRSFGFTVNLAPIADINSHFANPLISVRAFGEKEDVVSQMTVKTIKGLQENGVAACVAHFPGLGPATMDCYDTLCAIPLTEDSITQHDLKPFVNAVNARVECCMLSDATYPGIDTDGFPASLSPKMVALLRGTLNFRGLILTDALDVKAILERIPPEEASTLAVRAGVDMVVSRGSLEDQVRLYNGIMGGLANRYYALQRVEDAATRILKQKFRRSLDAMPFRDDPSGMMMKIARDSITVLRNWDEVLPLRLEGEHWVGVLSPHPPNRDVITLGEALQGKHTWVEEVQYDPAGGDLDWDEISEKFASCATLIVVTSTLGPLGEQQVEWINRIFSLEKPVVLVALQNPYHLMHFPAASTYVATYGHSPSSLEALVEVLLGETSPRGRLPITIPGDVAQYGEGVGYSV